MTTVGYGDILPRVTSERILSILCMLFGVVAFSFATGTLSSILTNADSADAALKEKMLILEKIKTQYELTDVLSFKIEEFFVLQHALRDEEI